MTQMRGKTMKCGTSLNDSSLHLQSAIGLGITTVMMICALLSFAYLADATNATPEQPTTAIKAANLGTVPAEKNNSQILQELEQLRSRIQELETQLKQSKESAT